MKNALLVAVAVALAGCTGSLDDQPPNVCNEGDCQEPPPKGDSGAPTTTGDAGAGASADAGTKPTPDEADSRAGAGTGPRA